jgi:hypothetical protein
MALTKGNKRRVNKLVGKLCQAEAGSDTENTPEEWLTKLNDELGANIRAYLWDDAGAKKILIYHTLGEELPMTLRFKATYVAELQGDDTEVIVHNKANATTGTIDPTTEADAADGIWTAP